MVTLAGAGRPSRPATSCREAAATFWLRWIAAAAGTLAVTGAAVGAVHGLFLLRLLRGARQ